MIIYLRQTYHLGQQRISWYLERYHNIKVSSSSVYSVLCRNGKVERSHLTDQTEFYQLIEYTDDVDIAQKLSEWEIFYNCHRPNAALKGKTPYEVLKEKLSLNNNSFSNSPSQKYGGV